MSEDMPHGFVWWDVPLAQRWDNLHRTHDRGMLSSSNPAKVMKTHGIDVSEVRGRRVMDIGVGTGGMSKHLLAIGVESIVAVDVSEWAFFCLPDQCERVLMSELPLSRVLSFVDVAICHLVMQHCEDEVALETLVGIRGSLRDHGWASVQWGDASGPVLGDRGDVKWRSKDDCLTLCEAAGFHVESCITTTPNDVVSWHMTRLR